MNLMVSVVLFPLCSFLDSSDCQSNLRTKILYDSRLDGSSHADVFNKINLFNIFGRIFSQVWNFTRSFDQLYDTF